MNDVCDDKRGDDRSCARRREEDSYLEGIEAPVCKIERSVGREYAEKTGTKEVVESVPEENRVHTSKLSHVPMITEFHQGGTLRPQKIGFRVLMR